MKKTMKSELTKEKIIFAAIEEFGINGYDSASLNSMCERYNISKGLIYHNFQNKDEIYLICVQKVFDAFVKYIKEFVDTHVNHSDLSLKSYLLTRNHFFKDNPMFQRIFCESVFFTPPHLKDDILDIKKEFDELNSQIICHSMLDLKVRLDVSQQKMISILSQFFDVSNAVHYEKSIDHSFIDDNELSTLNLLLYGILDR